MMQMIMEVSGKVQRTLPTLRFVISNKNLRIVRHKLITSQSFHIFATKGQWNCFFEQIHRHGQYILFLFCWEKEGFICHSYYHTKKTRSTYISVHVKQINLPDSLAGICCIIRIKGVISQEYLSDGYVNKVTLFKFMTIQKITFFKVLRLTQIVNFIID